MLTAAEPAPTPTSPPPGVGHRILVVDDEVDVLGYFSRVLRRLGDVETAGSRREALDTLREARVSFDLVVADLVLGDGSGEDVLVAAAGYDAGTRGILVTGKLTRTEWAARLKDTRWSLLQKGDQSHVGVRPLRALARLLLAGRPAQHERGGRGWT